MKVWRRDIRDNRELTPIFSIFFKRVKDENFEGYFCLRVFS